MGKWEATIIFGGKFSTIRSCIWWQS